MTYYFVQLKTEEGNIHTVGHSEDEEVNEVFYKFINKKQAIDLLNNEKKKNPDLKYRLVKVIEKFEPGAWQQS